MLINKFTKGFLALIFLAGCAQVLAGRPGVMLHILPQAENDSRFSSRDFLENLSRDILKIRPSHVILTLGQNNGFYLGANKHLQALCPSEYREVSNSDRFLLEFSRILNSNGIKFYLYLPFRGPQKHQRMLLCLDDKNEQLPPSSLFLSNWSKVIEWWSYQFGENLGGWWLDGAYNTNTISKESWAHLCTALLSGNQNRDVALNLGEGPHRAQRRISPCQTFASGELNELQYIAPQKSDEIRPHALTYLGSSWGKIGTRYPLKKYTEALNHFPSDTMITFDLGVEATGNFDPEQMLQFQLLSSELTDAISYGRE